VAFVKYNNRLNAEFAKEAMASQPLVPHHRTTTSTTAAGAAHATAAAAAADEHHAHKHQVLNIRWAHDDPNPVVQRTVQSEREAAVLRAAEERGYLDGGGAVDAAAAAATAAYTAYWEVGDASGAATGASAAYDGGQMPDAVAKACARGTGATGMTTDFAPDTGDGISPFPKRARHMHTPLTPHTSALTTKQLPVQISQPAAKGPTGPTAPKGSIGPATRAAIEQQQMHQEAAEQWALLQQSLAGDGQVESRGSASGSNTAGGGEGHGGGGGGGGAVAAAALEHTVGVVGTDVGARDATEAKFGAFLADLE
jgi:hypothetical protein